MSLRFVPALSVLLLVSCSAAQAPAEAQGPGQPVAQAAPEKKDATPAFPEQTRAPQMASDVALKIETVAEGLVEPWGMAILPSGDALVSERPGRLRVVSPAGVVSDPITGIPEVDARGQGGLLDVSLSPNFAVDRMVFFTFSEPRGDRTNATALARGALSADMRRLEGVEVIFRQDPPWASTLHFGSNIEWDRDGHLFLTLGERSMPAARVLSQDLSTHLGKVVRLTRDGRPAPGNPFLGKAEARPEIWSYGHRNVQGAAIHPDSGDLWTIEHGPRGGDELNRPVAGGNYGWPVIVYGIEYPGGPVGEGVTARAGMEQPVYYWDPVIAPGDMIFYSGNLFPWKGDLLISGLRSGTLVRLRLSDGKVVGEERLALDIGRIRDVAQAADGSLLVITDENRGVLARIAPAG